MGECRNQQDNCTLNSFHCQHRYLSLQNNLFTVPLDFFIGGIITQLEVSIDTGFAGTIILNNRLRDFLIRDLGLSPLVTPEPFISASGNSMNCLCWQNLLFRMHSSTGTNQWIQIPTYSWIMNDYIDNLNLIGLRGLASLQMELHFGVRNGYLISCLGNNHAGES